MPEESFEEKTESATPRRRTEAREKGHVSRSMDLNTAVILLGAVLALNFFGNVLVNELFSITRLILGNLARFEIERDQVYPFFGYGLYVIGMALLPVLVVVMIFGVAINLFQVGFVMTPDPLVFDLSKLNPITGIQRLFQVRAWVRLIMSLFKVILIGAVLYWTIWGERHRLMGLWDREFPDIVKYLVETMFLLSMRAVLALLVLAIFDYSYQRWQYEKDLKMSKQEVKEEMKRLEGDPKIRERRRVIQRKLAMQRMMQKVPKATVVITNPTEYAVAIQFERDEMAAPIVVAKGMGWIAQKIRDLASENNVPIVEKPPLARALYKSVEVGQAIPYDMYKAVAEVLAYVHGIKNPKKVA